MTIQKRNKGVPRGDWSATRAPAGPPTADDARRQLAAIERNLDTQRECAFLIITRRHNLPSLKSAIDEISGLVADRMGGKNTPAQEDALTRAAVALGQIRAALNPHVAHGDPNWTGEAE